MSRRRLAQNEPTCLRRQRGSNRCLEWSDGRGSGLRGAMTGTFCEKKVAAKNRFDRRSFRWKKSGKAWILIGCPRGEWKPRAQSCAVGTRAYSILSPTSGSCPASERRIQKG